MRLFLVLIIVFQSSFRLGSVHLSNLKIENTNKVSVKNEVDEEYVVYSNMADTILLSHDTRLTGDIFAESWSKTKDEYGIDVPLTLALAQAKLESGFCTSKSSIQKNNPFGLRGKNSYRTFNSLSDGVDAYYKLMATRYLNCRSLEQLLKNFVSCGGYRYAGSKNYESNLKREIGIIESKIK